VFQGSSQLFNLSIINPAKIKPAHLPFIAGIYRPGIKISLTFIVFILYKRRNPMLAQLYLQFENLSDSHGGRTL